MKGHARTGQFWSKEQLNHVLEPSSKEAVSVGPRMQFDLAHGVNASPGSRARSWRRIWEGRTSIRAAFESLEKLPTRQQISAVEGPRMRDWRRS
jgi:hypothetical protein